MYLNVFDRNPFGTNCWLLAADGSEDAVVVDPGFEPEEIRSVLERAGKRPAAVLLTHAHLDHAYAAGIFAGDDVPVFLHEADAVAFDDIDAWNPGFDNPLEPVKDLRAVVDGDELSFAGFSIVAKHTPGHTPGHCCFATDATLIAGDLVFAGSIGMVRLPELFAGRHADEPSMVPHARRHHRGAPGSRLTNDRRAGARSNPFLVELPDGSCSRRGEPNFLPPQGSRMRALYDQAATLGASMATGTSRRPASRRPSSSHGRRARRAMSSPRRCTRSRIARGVR